MISNSNEPADPAEGASLEPGLPAIPNGLREYFAFCGDTDKNELVRGAIAICIDNGIDTRRDIISVLGRLGRNPAHVAIQLKEIAGNRPERYDWWIDGERRYHLHEPLN